MPWSSSDRAARLPGNWASLRLEILKRDGYLCQIRGPGCTQLATEVDHILPGDDHRPANLQPACRWCHSRKTAREGVDARGLRWNPVQPHPGLIVD